MEYKFVETWSDFILNETLKTHDIDLTLYHVNSELGLLGLDFKIEKNPNNTLLLTLNDFNHLNLLEDCIDMIDRLFIDRHGWFPTGMEITNLSGMVKMFPYNEEILKDGGGKYYEKVSITYESKYDIECELPDKLYHLSIQEYKSGVMKNGLVPKSKSKLSKHLDRIYVCTHIKDCYNLINQMKFYYRSRVLKNSRDKINYKWVIYQIDSSGLEIKLYKDPNYIDGYYIIENISGEFIKIADSES